MITDTMSTLKERLEEALKESKITKTAIWKACGLSSGAVSQWFSGSTQKIEGENLLNAARVLNVNPDWLATGKGRMKNKSNFEENIESAPSVMKSRVPEIDWVAAGQLCESSDLLHPGDAIDWYETPIKMSKRSFVLRIKGESMLPEYRENELIFVDPEVQHIHGSDVIAKTPDNKATFKRLQITQDGTYLLAINEKFPDRIIRMPEGTVICGVVVWSQMDRRK